MTISEFSSITNISRDDIKRAVINSEIDAYEDNGLTQILWTAKTLSFANTYKYQSQKHAKLGVCIKRYNNHKIYCRVLDDTNVYYVVRPDKTRVTQPFYNYTDALDYCMTDTTTMNRTSASDGGTEVMTISKTEARLILMHLPHNRFTDRLIRKIQNKLHSTYRKQIIKEKNNEWN